MLLHGIQYPYQYFYIFYILERKMKYCSTRNKKLDFNFEQVFQRSLAPDGGLFIPKKIKKFSSADLKKLKKLNYVDLAVSIILSFCEPTFNKQQLKTLISKSYKKFKKKCFQVNEKFKERMYVGV